jgi:cyanobactin maturation PatA/PatG family protease
MTLGETPVYALRPEGAYAREGYDRLRQGVREYLGGQVERISVAGVIVGQTQLMNGQVVPVVRPELRCSYTWTTNALVQAVAGDAPASSASQEQRSTYDARVESVANFLERAYEDFRNLGITPAERALNFAATNAMNVANVFATALQRDTQLDTVSVERSPVCPPDSDCWDVNLTFFNPSRQFEQARQVYKFTVNVIDVCPVMVGRIRTWAVR